MFDRVELLQELDGLCTRPLERERNIRGSVLGSIIMIIASFVLLRNIRTIRRVQAWTRN